MDAQSLRLLLAQGLDVDEIASRFDKEPSTVAHWMERHGLKTAAQEKHAPKGGIESRETRVAGGGRDDDQGDRGGSWVEWD